MKKILFYLCAIMAMTLTATTARAATLEENNDSAKIAKLMSKLPDYKFVKVIEQDENGQAVTNDDGTPVVRYMIATADNNIVAPEVAKRNIKTVLKSNLGDAFAKVGMGALIGGLGGLAQGKNWSDVAVDAAVGAGLGAVAAADNISVVSNQVKALKAFNKLVETYQKNFTDEGLPRKAKVDDKKLAKALDAAPELSKTAVALKSELESSANETIDEDEINSIFESIENKKA